MNRPRIRNIGLVGRSPDADHVLNVTGHVGYAGLIRQPTRRVHALSNLRLAGAGQ